ncbi:PepSY domain-containing protein [Levilactobacillus tujiorum]|uniref:PepSY domain-containing protein n=1 Tax=Levilactobacillus tujiorum TaxID=2912243 RepID=A0ABX1L465_9LACO|nr:PepSY domain-containing protein [Levilactobacillus tujiorum]MCH5465206.1 PepSY domain-containing protein [Levilactobacillus tujiorum]NLR12237.1 hypothetical protein [Lactobacillus sp. HBUAS51387]NLR29815.1 hypothetical protein [Levilactobacillus tujiorum]
MKRLGILFVSVLVLAGCQASKPKQQVHQSNQTEQQTSHPTAASPKTIKVSVKTAISRLHQQFNDQISLSELSLERENGQYRYEVAGLDNTYDYEVVVDARSGKVLHHEKARLDHDETAGVARKHKAIEVRRLKDLKQISAIATQKVGGGSAVKWSLEREHDQVQWEVKVRDGQQTQEVAVNAYTGKVMTVQPDDDEDDD